MIHTVLTILKTKLGENCVIADIANGDDVGDKIVISLLNIEEEATLKNSPRFERAVPTTENPKGYVNKNPSAYLNLYVMISANKTTYEHSLISISEVIEILQANRVVKADKHEFKIQLHSLPLDQLSYAWGLLGGKVMPSVLYKVSIIKIEKADATPLKPTRVETISLKDIENKPVEVKH